MIVLGACASIHMHGEKNPRRRWLRWLPRDDVELGRLRSLPCISLDRSLTRPATNTRLSVECGRPTAGECGYTRYSRLHVHRQSVDGWRVLYSTCFPITIFNGNIVPAFRFVAVEGGGEVTITRECAIKGIKDK